MTQTQFLTKDELLATKPEWAKAAIFAEAEVDQSDSQSDYFGTGTDRRVFLGWSKHTKDLFPELRKAAARFPETAHLGPGKGLYTVQVINKDDIINNGSAYWKGSVSHWHSDLVGRDGTTFTTEAEAEEFVAMIQAEGGPEPISFDGKLATFELHIKKENVEHREKYSMGAGYYLKASGRYSSGWKVVKSSWYPAKVEVLA